MQNQQKLDVIAPDDFNSLHELPDSYIWPNDDDYPSFDAPDQCLTVPIIDLTDPNALELISHACRTWGVFQVTNHGIPQKLVDDMEFVARTLFSLPTQQKLKVARAPGAISGYGSQIISPLFEKRMWCESFTALGSPLEYFRKLWPQNYSNFCYIAEEYTKEMKKLSARMMWLILGPLGISKEDIKWSGPHSDFEDVSPVLQLNYYPACPDPSRAMGLAQHTDTALFALVHQTNNAKGLQIFREGTGWVVVPPVPGAFVFIVGDFIHMLSNGIYPTVVHRAMVNPAQHRLSIAIIYFPPKDAPISPISKLVTPSRQQLYPPITWNQYIGIKAKLHDKALHSLRICAPIN